MPKQKTRRGAYKRLKITGSGKVRRGQAYKRHILTKKHPNRKRRLRKQTLASSADHARLKRLLAS